MALRGYPFVLVLLLSAVACQPDPVPPSPPIEEPAKPVPPSAPGAVRAEAEVGGATLVWSAPEENGGSALTGYQVDSEPREASLRMKVEGTTAHVTGLRAGGTYRFSVGARNEAGVGPVRVSDAVTLPDVPGAPEGVTAARGDRQVAVAWTAPASDGGRPVLGYLVTAHPQGTQMRVEAPAHSAVVTGLTNGVASTWTVRALNTVGEGPESPASASVVPAAVPSAVREVRAVPGGKALTVSWREPADTGGLPVEGYVVTVEPGGLVVRAGASAREVTVAELSRARAYTLTVAALNAVGTGPATGSSAVRPLPGTARVTALTVPSSPGACVSLTYALGQDDSERADVLVEVDVQGNGTFRPATQAGSTDHEGTLARATSVGGTEHRFLWNRAQDVRGAASVQVRVSARVAGAAAGSRTVAVSLPATNQTCELSLDGAHVSAFPETQQSVTPLSATTGDFDQDGKLDMVIFQQLAGTLLLKGLGNGHFLPGAPLMLDILRSVYTPPVAADVDGDGALDLLWVEEFRTLLVARGLGNGSFAPALRYNTAFSPLLAVDKAGLVVADFNGDGRPDVALGGGRGPGLFLNQGEGLFGVFQPLNVAASVLLAADLDADGRQDLVLPRYDSPGTVMLSNGDGTFRSLPTDLPLEPVLEDADADGRVDALYVMGNGVFLRRGDGRGGFSPAVRVATTQYVSSVPGTGTNATVGDLDGDGRLDFAFVAISGQSHVAALLKGQGDGSFAPEVTLPVPRLSNFLSHGDFNGDGVADLFVLQSSFPSREWDRRDVRVWPGGPARLARSMSPAPPGPVATGDLNADGWEDVLSANTSNAFDPLLQVSFGGPTGLSVPQTVFPLPGFVHGIDILHLDTDATLDVLIHGFAGDQAILLLGNGDGTLRGATNLQLNSAAHAEAGDVNKDGKPDLVFNALLDNGSRQEAHLRLGRGDGTFEAPIVLADLATTDHPQPLSLVDLNRDGSLDVVILVSSGNTAAQVLLGQGDGSFTTGAALSFATPGWARNLRVADMDGDGIADVVHCRHVSDTRAELTVLKGTGTGTFNPPLNPVSTSAYCAKLLLVDLDGDGRRDVLAGSWNSDSVSVWRGLGEGQFARERSFGTFLHDPGPVITLEVLDADGDGRKDILAGHGLRVNTLLLQR